MKYSAFEPLGKTAVFPAEYEVLKGCDCLGDEGFELLLEESGRLSIYANTPRARRYAASEAARLAGKTLECGKYVYAPEFSVRGIIEGFYGKPWTVEERRRLLSVLSSYGMNEYFYGPKDDPFHRDRWDELYGPNDAEVLKSLIDISEENCMDFRYMLAPGLSIRYSAEEDRAKLREKYRQVMSFGVKKFGLLLDDLESAELYPEDSEVYPRQVDAHIDLVNHVFAFLKSLDPEAGLIVCPTQYWGETDRDYITSLGRGIPAECELFYTGPYICSDCLTADFAREFYKNTGHRVVWWDNYPVNDMEMTDELHLSPLSGREAGLGGHCTGLVSNPMELAEASLLSLITVADYLWNSRDYDGAESFAVALDEVAPGHGPAVRTLSRLCYKSCLEREGYHFRFEAPLGCDPEFEAAFAAGAYPLWQYFKKTEAELKGLLGSELKIAAECRRWIETALKFCDAGACLTEHRNGEKLKKYLCEKEDIMKREARKLLDIFEK